MFQGSMVAIITPFDAEGNFDEQSYRQLIEFQIENGTDVIVPCGTTGESATLSYEEHDRVIKTCIDQVNKRVPVIAGTGSNATAEAIDISQHAKEQGADGLLLVSPYYNKPSPGRSLPALQGDCRKRCPAASALQCAGTHRHEHDRCHHDPSGRIR